MKEKTIRIGEVDIVVAGTEDGPTKFEVTFRHRSTGVGVVMPITSAQSATLGDVFSALAFNAIKV